MKTFIVLGMHRSATSLVAKGLYESGVHIGDRLIGADISNPYGHYEDMDFVSLNEKILNNAKGSWNKPPTEESILGLADIWRHEIKELVEEKQMESLWGWKDPRTILTIRLFLPYLTNPHFIVCFRDPREVAKSLAKRDRHITRKAGLVLAKIYNDRLLRFLSEWASDKYQL